MAQEIFIGSDHRGYELKNQIVAALSGAAQLPDENIESASDFTVSDLGPFSYNPDDDYNDAAVLVAQAVREHPGSMGILVCGSAHGVAIQANRIRGVRAIAAYTPALAEIGRLHNDANVLCLSADFTGKVTDDSVKNPSASQVSLIKDIITTFLDTKFSGEERHARRNRRLDDEINGGIS
ncbi:RpiB/LacA/LacB family sugar-phosphate isomerase [Candidatus Saccharibacteria bacterium]|nr:RpiB/LacA/LacB family sugar-phosphate isomerase [Candidatus Saccharibacteria bacterium]